MNFILKQLAKAARIDKRLRFHMSRFTFATTVCLTQGANHLVCFLELQSE